MANQFFDKDGTTKFQFTFVDRNKVTYKKIEWCIFFAQGFILIDNHIGTHIKVNFPEEDHWTYEKREEDANDGGLCHGAEIKNKEFTLTVDVQTYLQPGDPEYDPEYHEYSEPEGSLELDNKIIKIKISIPYKLAINMIKFMSGSTELSGVCGVIKS
jgi:hypothetical protein